MPAIIFPARDGFSVSLPHIWVMGDFVILDAEDTAAPFNVNFHKETDKYENQNERQGWRGSCRITCVERWTLRLARSR
jgi:hypothetical protein